jgi:tellurite resistance protein
MIIFGTRGVTTNPQKGEFHCPSCGPAAQFRWRRVRRFFTLYFIPVIPLDLLGEYVECEQCRGTYDVQVLEFDPQEAALDLEASYQTGMRQVMIAMLLADGVIDDSEVAAIQKIYRELSGQDLPEAQLRGEIAEIEQQGASIDPIVGHFAGMLNNHGKEKVIEAAYLVAMSDGEFHETEQVLLYKTGEGLGLSKSHFSGLMNTLMAGEKIAETPGQGLPPLPPN